MGAPLTSEQAAALDAPHVVHAVTAAGVYAGLVPLAGDLQRVSGPPPGEHWRWAAGAWLPAPTIAQAKVRRWSDIKVQREARLQGTFTAGELVYDINTTNITGAAVSAMRALAQAAPFAQTWVLADNATTVLDAAAMLAVGDACAAAVNTLWATSIALRAQLDAIDDDTGTLAEVAAVVWPE